MLNKYTENNFYINFQNRFHDENSLKHIQTSNANETILSL